MKIKSLEFEAFGPYLEKQYLDFTSLNEAELFLVTGDTGAGKTTIFDAVSFALYGVSSGDVRQVSQFRNQRATSDIETYVKLTFEIRNKIYVITRYPNYLREGYKTETRHRAYLEGAGEHIIEGVSEVGSKIKEIVGVDADEFRQVAMIAQGQFTRLIQATSREREAILRELFSTHAFAAFQERLKKQEKEKKEKFLAQKLKLDTYLEEIEESSRKEPLIYLQNQKDKIQNEQKELDVEKERGLKENEKLNGQLERAYQQDQWAVELENSLAQKEQLDEKKEEMRQLNQKIKRLGQVERIIPYHDHYKKALLNHQETENRLAKINEKKGQLDEKMRQLLSKKEEVGQLKEQLSINERTLEKINEDLHKVEQFEKAKNLVRQAKNQVDATLLEVKNSQKQKAELEKILTKCQADLDALPNLEAMKLSLAHQSNTLKMNQVKMNQLEIQKSKLDALMAERTRKQSNWEKETEKLRELSDKQILLEKEYQASLAGILAMELKENMPCPVCGSLHHPQMATLRKKDVTKEMMEEHKTALDKQNQIVQSAFGQLIQVKQSLELENNHYQEMMAGESLSHLSNQYQSDLKDFEIKKQTYQDNFKRQEQLHLYQKDYNERYLAWQKKDQDVQDRFEKVKENLQKRNETFEFIRGSFHDDFETLDVLLKRKQPLERTIRNQTSILDQYQETFENIEKASLQNEGELSALIIEKEKAEQQLWDTKMHFEKRLESSNLKATEFLPLKQEVSALDSYQKTYLDYDKQCAFNHAQIFELSQKLEGERLDSTSLKAKKSELETHLKDIEVATEKNQWQLVHLQKQYQDIENCLKKFQSTQKKYQDIYELSRLVSGQNPQHITFESYILAAYFEAILERANLRFVAMSNGRYALLRKQDGLSGRAMQGLDLNVMDYESGKPRDVRTLSGGEAFKAALSLALGMADLISENAGGIELDTLFIDEGFGSLDERSLDIALDTLIELKQEHKVVGIISHVGQLKERLSAKIVVSHKKNTSIAKIS